ncbi:hypothetical protein ACJX0J_035230 [Zea mays]
MNVSTYQEAEEENTWEQSISPLGLGIIQNIVVFRLEYLILHRADHGSLTMLPFTEFNINASIYDIYNKIEQNVLESKTDREHHQNIIDNLDCSSTRITPRMNNQHRYPTVALSIKTKHLII